MASKKSGSQSELEKKTADTKSMIPLGHEHNRFREALANAGAGVNLPDETGQTVLMFVVERKHLFCENHVQCAKEFIKAGANVNAVDTHGLTPLMLAVIWRNHEFVDLLIDAGADVNHRNSEDQDALYLSAHDTNYTVVEILLKAGADFNVRCREGLTPLLAIVNKEIYSLLLGEKLDTFQETSRHVKTVNTLIKAGADVNAETSEDKTLLVCVSYLGYVECMKSLLEAGVDVNKGRQKEKAGATALILASRYHHYKCLDMLLNAGADVNMTDDNGATALYLCVEERYKNNKRLQCIRRFLQAGIKFSEMHKNALGILIVTKATYQEQVDYKDTATLLYAAGETLEGTEEEKIPKALQFEKEQFKLKHICREAIRKHLLKLDPHQHLFGRIPKLGLPSLVTDYLLFNMSLDKDDDDN